MKAYLAAKYMSGPKADAILSRTNDGVPKKKKRKTTHASSTASASFIKDDDIAGWDAVPKEPEEDDGTDLVVASDRGFKKKQRAEGDSGWATVREGLKNEEEEEPADEKPQVVEDKPFRGGLMSAEQLRKTFKKHTQETQLTQEEIAAAQETVYRDASGRKVDMAAERAEAARRKREKEEKEAKKMEWGKGLVQREEVEKQKKELQSLKGKDFARTVDDVEMNEDLKAQDRWNDPAAAFLTVCFLFDAHYGT